MIIYMDPVQLLLFLSVYHRIVNPFRCRENAFYKRLFPVLQKTSEKWESSTENMYARDGVLNGDINMALLLQRGSNYGCDFKTTYK